MELSVAMKFLEFIVNRTLAMTSAHEISHLHVSSLLGCYGTGLRYLGKLSSDKNDAWKYPFLAMAMRPHEELGVEIPIMQWYSHALS